MRKLFLIFCSLFIVNSYSQEPVIYKYYMYITNSELAPSFGLVNNKYKYIGTDENLKTFFSNYTIHKFERTIEFNQWESLTKILTLETEDSDLAQSLINTYPSIYTGFDEFTNDKIELLYYPNDYGLTNPNGDLGAAISREDLDYINVHEAWDFPIVENVSIGMTDSRINNLDADFSQKTTYFMPSTDLQLHGTHTAGIAAGQGDNNHGSTGVCYNCDLVSTKYGDYNALLALAQTGVRVINMSWTSGINRYPWQQNLINIITNELHVVLVAGAGNAPSTQTATDFVSYVLVNGQPIPIYPPGVLRFYPASYDNVISVSGVGHYNPVNLPLTSSSPGFCCNNTCCTSPSFDVFLNMQDSFSANVGNLDPMNPIGLIYNGYPSYPYNNSPNGLVSNFTSNPEVDMLAPTSPTFNYAVFATTGTIEYTGGGTSTAAPFVSGTAGLMLGVNPCLTTNYVDNILKLTSKDVEALPINQNFIGQIGAGALDAGDAVEFVNEMKKIDGTAVINHHIFWRFNFDIRHFNNNLSIDNAVFREGNTSLFEARNSIELNENTDINPNNNGFMDLRIDPNIVVCDSITTPPIPNPQKASSIKNETKSSIKLYPNPNNGSFTIALNKEIKDVKIYVYDAFSKLIYTSTESGSNLELNIPNLPTGLYLVKIESNELNETIKFIKQ